MSNFALMFIILFSSSYIAQADTLLKIKTEEGGVFEIMSDGKNTRISMSPEPGYILINHSNKTMFLVIPEGKRIMDMISGMPAQQESKPLKVDIKIKQLSKGPEIAGYSTIKYSLKADGQNCGTIYGSKKALKNENLKNIYNSINQMMENQSRMMGGVFEMMDACERADMDPTSQTKVTGLPLRSVDKNGVLTSEIISIDTHAKLSADTFVMPSDYTVTTMADEMRGMQQQVADEMQNMQQHMPDMEEMMKQMSKSGQITPEAMDEIKKIQEMMEQLQD